jgi:GGDEF domain-containing protein
MDREVVEALEAAQAAILGQLRPADALIRERPGRYWLTTPDTDGADARALGDRIAAAVDGLPPHRGAPLQVAIGVTACPDDGVQTPALESLAEEALFAARAAGLRVAGPPAAR